MKKSMNIKRQLAILVTAFAVATPAALIGLTVVLNHSASTTRNILSASRQRNDDLFALISSVADAQGFAQQLMREKDPDKIEKLMGEAKVATERARAKVDGTAGADGEISAAFHALREANEKSVEALLIGDYGQAQQRVIEESNPAFARLFEAIGKVRDEASRQEQAVVQEAESASSRAHVAIFGAVAAVLGVLIFFSVIVMRRVHRALTQAVTELTNASDGTAGAAAQVSSSAQALAQGASEQAASLEETSATSEEINSMTRQNAENARRATSQMSQAVQLVDEANSRLSEMVRSMNDINASSDKVSKIIQTIDEIAFQTNILALNAAVEAARAGEAGMGFAVVADEVRNLAQRCAKAARDTAVLITESIAKSNDGKAKLHEVSDAMAAITRNAHEVKALIEEIRVGSEEQANGIEQVSRAIVQMEQVTQAAAANAEESAAASEELSSQAASMKETVTRLFRLVGD
jgi:methyl-accepting chemotaxis protein